LQQSKSNTTNFKGSDEMPYALPVNLATEVNAEAADVMSDLNYLLGLFNGSNPWPFTAGSHGDLSATTTTMHTAIAIAYANAKVTGTNLKAAVDELVTWLNYDKSDPTKKPEKKVGLVRDNTVYTAVSGAGSYSAGSLKITVPANTASTKLVVKWGAYASVNGAAGGAISLFVPLRVETTDLSTSGSPDPNYHVLHGYSGDSGASATCPMMVTELASPTVDLTAEQDISIGTIFATIAGGASLAQLTQMWLEVYAM
jgi:hypothetical protein